MGFIDIDPDTVRAMQLKSFEMALYFKKICDENGLLFYFCGGCCIGAVREKGFIKWDDDVDVFMPRDDYERLIKIWNDKADTSRYELQVTTKERFTRNQFATICDSNTTFIKSYQADLDINHGLQLDILPLDGCPDGFKRKKQKLFALAYSLFLIGKPPTNHGKAVEVFGKAVLAVVPSKKLRYRLWRYCERHMIRYKIKDCDRITELCSGPYYMQFEYPKSAFESAELLEFEGVMMPVPCGWDDYLKMAFGDYMAIPPKEKQCCHHEVECIDLENSYKIYKGKYYCVKEKK